MFLFWLAFSSEVPLTFPAAMKSFLTCNEVDKPKAIQALETLFFVGSLESKQRIWVMKNMLKVSEALVSNEKKNFWNLYRVVFFERERTDVEADVLHNLAFDTLRIQKKEISEFRSETKKNLRDAFPWAQTWSMTEKAEMFLSLIAADESDKSYILSVILAMQDRTDVEASKAWASFYLKTSTPPSNPKCYFYADFARYLLNKNPEIDQKKYDRQSPFVKAFLAMKDKRVAACAALISHCENMYAKIENVADAWIIQYFHAYVRDNFDKYLAGMDLKSGDTLSAIGTILSSQLGQHLVESNKSLLLGIKARVLIDLGNKAEAMEILERIKGKKELVGIIRSCACTLMYQSDFSNARKLLEESNNPDLLFWLLICNQIEYLQQAQQEQESDAESVVSQGESLDFGDDSEQESADERPEEVPVSVEWHAQQKRILSYTEQCEKAAEKRKLKLVNLKKLVECASRPDLQEDRKIRLSQEVFSVAEQLFGVAKEGRNLLTFDQINNFIIAIRGRFSAESEKIKISFPSLIHENKMVFLSIDKSHGARQTGVFDPSDTYHHRLIRVLRFHGYDSSSFNLKS